MGVEAPERQQNPEKVKKGPIRVLSFPDPYRPGGYSRLDPKFLIERTPTLKEKYAEFVDGCLEGFVFLRGATVEQAREIASHLASQYLPRINGLSVVLLSEPEKNVRLQRVIFERLRGSRWNDLKGEEVEKLTGYFARFCGGNERILREIAYGYYSLSYRESGLPVGD